MRLHIDLTAAVPGGELAVALAAIVVDVLERADEEGNAAVTGDAAEYGGPGAADRAQQCTGLTRYRGTYSVVVPESNSMRAMAGW